MARVKEGLQRGRAVAIRAAGQKLLQAAVQQLQTLQHHIWSHTASIRKHEASESHCRVSFEIFGPGFRLAMPRVESSECCFGDQPAPDPAQRMCAAESLDLHLCAELHLMPCDCADLQPAEVWGYSHTLRLDAQATAVVRMCLAIRMCLCFHSQTAHRFI